MNRAKLTGLLIAVLGIAGPAFGVNDPRYYPISLYDLQQGSILKEPYALLYLRPSASSSLVVGAASDSTGHLIPAGIAATTTYYVAPTTIQGSLLFGSRLSTGAPVPITASVAIGDTATRLDSSALLRAFSSQGTGVGNPITLSATAVSFADGTTGYALFVRAQGLPSGTIWTVNIVPPAGSILDSTRTWTGAAMHGSIGPLSASTTGTPIYSWQRELTYTVATTGALGATVFVDVNNLDSCPASTDATQWRCLTNPGIITTAPVGGASGQVDNNAYEVPKGYRWMKWRLEGAIKSNQTLYINWAVKVVPGE